MSMLENIKRGRESKPPRLFIYGQEGVGKSTVGAAAPNPVFVQTEDGLGEIDTAKFPLAKNLNDVLAALTALREEPHDFQTVVLDSADWLERLIWDQVCAEFGVRSIEKADGGYGKGYVQLYKNHNPWTYDHGGRDFRGHLTVPGGKTALETSLWRTQKRGRRKGRNPRCLRRMRPEMKQPAKVVDLAGLQSNVVEDKLLISKKSTFSEPMPSVASGFSR